MRLFAVGANAGMVAAFARAESVALPSGSLAFQVFVVVSVCQREIQPAHHLQLKLLLSPRLTVADVAMGVGVGVRFHNYAKPPSYI